MSFTEILTFSFLCSRGSIQQFPFPRQTIDPQSPAHRPSPASLFLRRRKTTIDLGATVHLVCSRGTPRSEKSFGLGKAVSTILHHSAAVPSCTWNSSSSQYALIIT